MTKLLDAVKEVVDGDFAIHDVDYVPKADDGRLTFGNKGLRFSATTLYIDMRGSTAVLNSHNRASMGKIYKCYFHVIVSVIDKFKGEIRSFNGDGMLVFFIGFDKAAKNRAVRAALQIKYMLTSEEAGIAKKMDKYTSPDFGIGVDSGNILCTKIGIPGGNSQDLVWVGNAVNKAVRIGDRQRAPQHLGISKTVYEALTDDFKNQEKDWLLSGLLGRRKIALWQEVGDELEYNGREEVFYRSLESEGVLNESDRA
jgi:class 3 adenylate cyclase